MWKRRVCLCSPSFLPNAFLQPSHLQFMEHPTPPLKRRKIHCQPTTRSKEKKRKLHILGSIHSISWGIRISCSCILFCGAKKQGCWWGHPARDVANKFSFNTCVRVRQTRKCWKAHTPPISDGESEVLITLGANARGFLDSICLRVASTTSSWMGLLKQSIHAHGSTQ